MDRAEAAGLGVALVGHAALLIALTLGIAAWGDPPPIANPFEVSFVEEVGLTSAAPQPTQQPPEQGMAPETGPPEDAAPAPVAEPLPPLPEPRPAPPAPRPAPKQALPAQPRERAQAQPSRPRPAPTQRNAGTGERTRRSLIGPDLLKGLGRDPSPARSKAAPAAIPGEARASINAAIRRALVPCERQPLPSPEAAAIKVDVRVTLNRNGSLASAQVARVRNDNAALRMYEQRMRDLALAIVRGCTPIRGLPAEYYDVPRGWRQFTYQFDPRQS
jgi:outer membrane biosynthesis protein TonB